MTRTNYMAQLLEHCAAHNNSARGYHRFELDGQRFMLDSTASGQTLLWSSTGELLTSVDGNDYDTLVEIAADIAELAD